MKISFQNLGIIKEMQLDLSKKLTVFCGPNGTGKTYACYAVYGFINRFFRTEHSLIEWDKLMEKRLQFEPIDSTSIFSYAKEFAESYSKDIPFVFGQSTGFEDFRARLCDSESEFFSRLKKAGLEEEVSYGNFIFRYKKDKDTDLLSLSVKDKHSIADPSSQKEMREYLETYLKKLLSFGFWAHSYMLPVERNSVYTFVDELVVNKINNLIPSNSERNRYPLPIQDTLSFAADLKQIKQIQSPYAGLADYIEKEILHGNISISDEGALFFTPDNAPYERIRSHLTASSFIKNLSSLLIYLRHLVKKDNLLIIDEPELGLHPDNQILLARILAKMVNSGLRVLISTHSDYIIRELNNLIMLSSDKINEDIIRESGYNDQEKLDPQDIGAYLFAFEDNKENRITVRELPVESTGFEMQSIDNVINNLNHRSMNLYYEINQTEE